MYICTSKVVVMLSLLLPLTMYNWMRIYFYIHTHILLHRGNY